MTLAFPLHASSNVRIVVPCRVVREISRIGSPFLFSIYRPADIYRCSREATDFEFLEAMRRDM
jgi:hypothetical protein